MNQPNTPFSYRELSFITLVMRLFVGSMLTLLAINKFALSGPVSQWSGRMVTEYTSTYLPQMLVTPIVYLLPYAQLGLGLLILFGLFSRPALAATSLLFVLATLGATAINDSITMAENSLYTMVTAVAFLFARWNAWSLDQALGLLEIEESIITGEDISVIRREEEARKVANIRK